MALFVDTLKATEIGKSVNALRKHGSKQIRHLARTLIEELHYFWNYTMELSEVLQEAVNRSLRKDNARLADENETSKDKGVYVGIEDDMEIEEGNQQTDSDYDGPADIWKEMTVALECSKFEQARQDQVLKQICSSIWGRPNRENLFSQQNQLQQQLMSQNRGGRILGGGGFESNGRYSRPLDLPQSAWPPLQVQHKNHQNQPMQHGGSGMRAIFLGGSGMKRECAGTGVFLPCRYDNPVDSRKKAGIC